VLFYEFFFFFVILGIVSVNVYCTAATGCQPKLQLINISYHNNERCII
jgi:hypothetical protein